MIQSSTIAFLNKLSKNNNKPWFDANRQSYEAAKEDFETFIAGLIKKTGTKDETIAHLQPKDCIFRINRDVRFAKDKSPYKTNFGAYINKGGKKGVSAGYYFHLEPGKSFTGGGLWMPMATELKKVRQEIDYCFDEFNNILNKAAFKKTYGTLDRSPEFILSKVPQGFEKESPAAEFLKLKSFIAIRNITDEELTDKNLLTNTVKAFETLQPLLDFINRSFHE